MLLIPWLLLPLVHWHMVSALDNITTTTTETTTTNLEEGATKADLLRLDQMTADMEMMVKKQMEGIADMIGKRSNMPKKRTEREKDPEEDSRVEKVEKQNNEIIKKAQDEQAKIVDRINTDTKMVATKKTALIKQTQTNTDKVVEGAKSSSKRYRKLEVEARGNREARFRLKQWVTDLPDLDGTLDKLNSLNDAIGNIATIIDPENSWQERTEAGLSMAGSLMEMLPDPIGIIGPAILSLAGAAFGAAAPTTNDFLELRNQIFDGVQDMFDGNQQSEAMGCIYKIEFLKNILDIHDAEEMTEKEFYALIMVGGIDVGVATLGTMKYKMEQYRDSKTVDGGRRALDMIHFYILLSEARDLLYNQIINFISLSAGLKNPEADSEPSAEPSSSESSDEEAAKGGMTTRFFENTRMVARSEYKNFFFLDDACCTKNEAYFTTMLAFNMPLKKHVGKDKAVHNIQRFLKTYRTDEYYAAKSNKMTDAHALSIDTVEGKGTIEEKVTRGDLSEEYPNPEKWYAFENVAVRNRFLGMQHDYMVNGASWPKAFGYGSSSTSTKLFCDIDNKGKVKDFGVSSVGHIKEGKMKFEYATELHRERFSAKVQLQNERTGDGQSGNDNLFLVTSSALKAVRRKIMDSGSQASSRAARQNSPRNAVDPAMDDDFTNYRQSWDMFAMCDRGKEYKTGSWSYKNRKSYTEKKGRVKIWSQTMEHGYIRLFRVRMNGWVEPRYMIGPAGELLDDKLRMFGADTNPGTPSNPQELPADASDAEKKTEITKSELDTNKWKKMFFEIRYISDSVDKNTGIFPMEKSGQVSAMKCSFSKGKKMDTTTTSWRGTLNHPDDCIAYCVRLKETDPTIDGVTTYKKQDNAGCYCTKGWRSSKRKTDARYQTCQLNEDT